MHRNGILTIAILLALSVGLGSQTTTAPFHASLPGPQGTDAGPQQKAAASDDNPGVIRAYTRMVVVDVIATDSKGNPIRDLKRDDLKVYEDAKEQTIRAFSFHQANVGAAPPELRLADHEVTNAPRYNATSSFNVIVFDTLNTVFTDQAYARDEVIKFVQKLPNDQPVAIFGLSSKKLQIFQDFTTDPALLKKAVQRMQGELSPLLMNPAGNSGSALPAQFAHIETQMRADRTRDRTNVTMEAFKTLGQVLNPYPGRKNVVWLTDGIPMGLSSLDGFGGNFFGDMGDYNSAVSKAAESLRSAQIAVYPIDAHGLSAPSFFDAAKGPGSGSLRQSLDRDSARNTSIHSAMNDLAERTGGRAFYNRNDLDNLVGKSIEDGSTYYTIGYYPENKNWDGKFRKIRVTLPQREAHLRYRIGYYATPSPAAAVSQDVKSKAGDEFSRALHIDFPASTGLLFRAGVTPPSAATQDKVLVSFSIQPDALRFVVQNDGLQHATVECGVQAFSAKGAALKARVQTVEASLKPETFKKVMQTGFPCQQAIDLPAGRYTLRLGVRDDRTGLIGSTNAEVVVVKK